METLETTYEAAQKLPPQQRNELAAMLQVKSDGEALSYDDARTMLGYQQAMNGEGYTVAEVDAYFQKKFEALKSSNE